MQKIDLICIGKLNASYFAAGVAEYQKRLGAFCEFRIIELPEETISEKNASQAVIDKALEKEGRAILANVRKGAALVALCVEGKLVSSEELAAAIADRAMSGAGDMAFDWLLPWSGPHGKAGGGHEDQLGTHHAAPPAGPSGAHRAALPGVCHQQPY